MNKIFKYLNGASWEDSGLNEIYGQYFNEDYFIMAVNTYNRDDLEFENVIDAKSYLLNIYDKSLEQQLGVRPIDKGRNR